MKLLLLTSLILQATCYKYLVVSPQFGFSHMKFMGKIADQLAEAGHDVTFFAPRVIEHFHDKPVTTNPNIKTIDYRNSQEGEAYATHLGSHGFKFLWLDQPEIKFNEVSYRAQILTDAFQRPCIHIFNDTSIRERLVAEKFDTAIIEVFDFCYNYYADFIKIRSVINVFSAVRNPALSSAVGLPLAPNYVPGGASSRYGAASGLVDRFRNLYLTTLDTMFFSKLYDNQFEMLKSYGVRYWKDIVADSSLVFTNRNPYLDFPGPTIDKVVPIGGFQMNFKALLSAKLDKEYEKILNLRPTTVYVSFGTVVRSADMPESNRQGILETFRRMPNTTFLWKYEEDDLIGKIPENVITRKWIPQPALLADSRVKAFVTHGGLGSILELAYTGKPAIVVPIFADQPLNSAMLHRHGSAIVFDKFQLADATALEKAIREIVQDEKYAKNAKYLADKLQNQPSDPKERLVKHAEFVAKFGKLPSQDPYGRQLNFFQYYFLDLAAIIAAAGIALGYVVVLVIRKVTGTTVSIRIKPKNE